MRHTTLGLSILLLLAFLNNARAESPYGDFKITDMPWVDINDLQLVIGANTNIARDQIQNSSLTPYSASQITGRFASLDLFLTPDLEYQSLLSANETRVSLPFQFKIRHSNSKHNDTNSYPDSNYETTEEYKQSQLDISIKPNLNYTEYFGTFFLNTNMSLEGSVTYRDLSEERIRIYPGATTYRKRSKIENYKLNFNELLKGGTGRIYEGNYAYQAMQIIDDLAQLRKIKRPITFDDMQDFSKLVAILRNEYYFDWRLKKMSDMRRLVEFLSFRDYIEANDYEAIFLIQDTYNNIHLAPRRFGSQTNIRLGYALELDNKESLSFESDHYLVFSKAEPINTAWYLGAEWRYCEPINTLWQFDVYATCDFYPLYPAENNCGLYGAPHLMPSIEAHLVYFLNTRFSVGLTNLSWLNLDLDSRRRTEEMSGRLINRAERHASIHENINITFDYQLNSNIKLTASFQCEYSLEHRLSGEYRYDSGGGELTPEQIQSFTENTNRDEDVSWSGSVGVQYEIF